MPDISETELEALLFRAIQNVRHRNLLKRPDSKHPMEPKTVTLEGKDWKPCEVCREETRLVMKELASGRE